MTAIERINENYSEFSKSQKKIADFIIKNTDKACFLSLKEMAEETETTEVTIINFSKKIGYDSFSNFKKELQAYIQMVLSPSDKIVNAITNMKDKESKLMEIIRLDLESLNRTVQGINMEDIKKAVEIIKNARRVYVVGESMSEVIADFLVLRMGLLGLDAVKLDLRSYNTMSVQMLKVEPTDVFIIASFPRYAKKPIILSEYLKENGNKIISITDKSISPVATRSEVIFTCATDTFIFYNSMTSPISLCNILLSALAFDMEENLLSNKDNKKKIEKYFYDRLEVQRLINQ